MGIIVVNVNTVYHFNEWGSRWCTIVIPNRESNRIDVMDRLVGDLWRGEIRMEELQSRMNLNEYLYRYEKH